MVVEKVNGNPIPYAGEVYVQNNATKQWYIRVADRRYNSASRAWQPIDYTRVPIIVRQPRGKIE